MPAPLVGHKIVQERVQREGLLWQGYLYVYLEILWQIFKVKSPVQPEIQSSTSTRKTCEVGYVIDSHILWHHRVHIVSNTRYAVSILLPSNCLLFQAVLVLNLSPLQSQAMDTLGLRAKWLAYSSLCTVANIFDIIRSTLLPERKSEDMSKVRVLYTSNHFD